MKKTEPMVVKLAETKFDPEAANLVLQELGAQKRIQGNSAADLIEFAGRICYKSFEVGLNPNVTKVREDKFDYFANIIKKGDGSILEHGSVTFAFLNVSRIFTHELCRHRVGTAISQESGRYVRPSEIGFWLPPSVTGDQQTAMEAVVVQIEESYRGLEKAIKWDEITFDEKKQVTSALRRVLPDGMATHVIWTGNHRTLRHVIEMRTDPAAEVEIRTVFSKVAAILSKEHPLIYQDFSLQILPDGTGCWKPQLRSKV